MKDHSGALWVAAGSGLYRRRGQVWERFTKQQGLPTNDMLSLREDSQRRLWAGTAEGLCQIAADAAPDRHSVLRTLRVKDGLPGESVQCLREQEDGRLWIGTNAGLGELAPQSSSLRTYTTRRVRPNVAPGAEVRERQ